MKSFITILFIFCQLLLISEQSYSYPLCSNKKSPFTSKTPLSFCQYNGSVCCNSTDDMQLSNQFKAMHVNDSGCSSLLKSILCSKCDPFSAELYVRGSETRKLPTLCNATVSGNSTDFCSSVWNKCRNVTIWNSPFSSSSSLNSTSKLSDVYKSRTAFCETFGGSSSETSLSSICFDGKPVTLNSTETQSPVPSGMCLEKLSNGSYLNMAAHPDGSDRVFLSEQSGKIWLAKIPEEGSGEGLGVDESSPFLDITDEVFADTEFGLLGIAFHHKFTENGRFFVSFNCDKAKWPQCSGRCACNSQVGCDPAKIGTENGAEPCRYHSVIAEFSANGTTSVRPAEVRRIFTMGLPFKSHHAGQILFGPKDGYLYLMMGDGGGNGDPYNFSQNKKSLLGKIMRFDIDNLPSASRIAELNLWGNYSIPKDNPFSEDSSLLPEIYAMGFRNPWRCSFDLERPSYFICADVGQDEYEEVNIVTKGGNYGWRVYEGPYPFVPPTSPGGNTSVRSINPIFPVMGYNHSLVNQVQKSASITGGYFYRSTTDPCLHGRYLYADLFGSLMWAGTERPINSGAFTSTQLNMSCASDSPIPCDETESSGASLGFILSFGQDNRKDVYVLASSGMYRVVRPSRCGFTCAGDNGTIPSRPGKSSPSPSPAPSTSASPTASNSLLELLLLSFSLAFIALFVEGFKLP